MLFVSTSYDMTRLGKELGKEGVNNVLGAATGCAIGSHGFQRRGISGFFLPPTRFFVVDALIENVNQFGLPDARQLANAMRQTQGRVAPAAPAFHFGLVMADADARCEERLIAALGMEFAGLPIVGGSAGDVYFNPDGHPASSRRLLYKGRALNNAAIFCLVAAGSPVHALSHNHYRVGTRKIVITDADPEKRLVREINGRPALSEYARACGFKKPSREVVRYAPYPLMIRIGGQYFARGMQRIYDDGSMEFACAIESGVVAAIAHQGDMIERLGAMFADLARLLGPPELVIGFECAARTVIMEQNGLMEPISSMFKRNNVVGFSCIGEQFNTVHVNNSFTLLAISARN